MRSKPNLKIALIQTALYWKDKTANFAMLEEKIWGLEEQVDLIILPEMFSTGFTMDVSQMAEPMNFTACKWLKQMANQTRSVVTGSVIIQENGFFFNRMLWAQPDAELLWYDKRHLFRMASEDQCFSMGEKKKIFELKGWKILPQVCYDLRFPVWSRNSCEDQSMGYDVCIFIANWPKPRIKAWDILLQARAIENSAYSVGVNRVGKDGNHILYPGHSAAYNYKGEQLVFSQNKEETLIVSLDADDLDLFREKFPVWKDADQFRIL